MADFGLSTILALAGTAVSTVGTLAAGAQEQERYKYEQKVARQQADEAKAASQRDALARTREGNQILSDQRAAIAGSGGSLADASVIDLMGDTRAQVRLSADTELYKGEQQSRGYNDAAKIAGINASNAMSSAVLNAGANLFSGVSSMYSRFGQQQQKQQSSSDIKLPYGFG